MRGKIPSLYPEEDHPRWPCDDVFPGLDDVRSPWQTFTLTKTEDYLLHPDVATLRFGLGWDRGADVDASVAMFDENQKATDIVWYKSLRSSCRSVIHSGDNLTGMAGDDEVISVDLSKIPLHVNYLLFSIHMYSFAPSLKDVESAYIRMLNGSELYKDKEMFKLQLTEMSGHTVIMGVLFREGRLWNFRALGKPATGRTILELLQNPMNLGFLSGIITRKAEYRHIAVTVAEGRDLAPQDAATLFTRASSDPYFTIKFRKKNFKSEYKSKTLNPVWESSPFELGWITEVETQPLLVTVFDYDVLSTDDFMGEVMISARELYALGPGRHTYWFMLGEKTKKTNATISGEILMHIDVKSA